MNEPKDKRIDDYTQGLTSEKRHRLYVTRKEEGRGVVTTVDCVDDYTQGLTSKKRHIQYLRRKEGGRGVVTTDDCVDVSIGLY